jgi:Protein of unknown function (DUF3261)
MTAPPTTRLTNVLEWAAVLSGMICVLQSCSLMPPGPVTAPPDQPWRTVLSLPSRPGYPGEVAVVQDLHAVHGDQAYDVQAVLQASAEHLVLVLTLPFGPRLATIDWSADGIAISRDPDLPIADQVPPEDVLADIVLTFWPEAAVRTSLQNGVALVVEPGRRLVMRDGVAVIAIRYDGADPWNGRTVLDNHLLGYQLTIVSRAVPAA